MPAEKIDDSWQPFEFRLTFDNANLNALFHNTGKEECMYKGSFWEFTRVADTNTLLHEIKAIH